METAADTIEDYQTTGTDGFNCTVSAESQIAETLAERAADRWRVTGLCSPRTGVIVVTYERPPAKGSP